MSWCCPRCHGALTRDDAELACPRCVARYPVVAGIPDLRIPGPSWIDPAQDRADAEVLAARLAAARGNHSHANDGTASNGGATAASRGEAAAAIRSVFAARPGWTAARVETRTREVLTAPQHLKTQIREWLAPIVAQDGAILDVGCGPGMLLAAAADSGRPLIGIDVSLVWLVAARALIEEYGGTADLAAALGEALPLADGAVGAVVSLDVIEHVDAPDRYLQEIDRALRPSGVLALSTPNRFSLAAEPHVGVWGVGWLPRTWQADYVRWRSGEPYHSVWLRSGRELRHLLAANTHCACRLMAPAVPAHALQHFPPHRRRLARLYNRLAEWRPTQPLLLFVGAFFRVVGVKR